jgi:hypothetical protein
MSRVSLSDTGDYRLINDEQDVRGYNVVDRSGQPVGVVETMVVDTDAEVVSSLLLRDGTEIPARDVTIGESVVYLDRGHAGAMASTAGPAGMAGGSTGMAPDYGRVTRREHVADVDGSFDTDFDDDFRGHHETTSGGAGRSYDETAGAYRFGYTAAHGDAHRNRPFVDAEADLRSGYTAGDFDADREAVRYGYSRAQRRAT